MLAFSSLENAKWYLKAWYWAKSLMIYGLIPLLKTSSYKLDYVKDSFMFIFLCKRLPFISSQCALLSGLVYFQGFSILAAGFLSGIMIQTTNEIINFSLIRSWKRRWSLRFLVFVISPLVPVVLILKSVNLSLKKRRLEAKWRKNRESSVPQVWLEYNRIDKKKKKLMSVFSSMKITEASMEAAPQLFFLVVFIFTSWLLPNLSGLGLLKEDNLYEWSFLVFSLLQTYITIIMAVLSNIDIRKRNQLGLRSKVTLGLSASLQMLARLLLMVPQFWQLCHSLTRATMPPAWQP